MSISEAFKGAAIEWSRLTTTSARAKYAVRTSRLFVQEILGTITAVPFGVRSLNLFKTLQKSSDKDHGVRLLTDVRYGPAPRNTMDVYTPPRPPQRAPTSPWPDDNQWGGNRPHACSSNVPRALAPVVVYVHGGVWATGSKWHYAALATRLSQAGCVVCVLEYSLYPTANSDCMVREVSDAITFVMDNAATYGGDAGQVTLFGHSAGAHLCFMALLHRAAAAVRTRASMATDDGALCTGDARMPARAVLAAGPYDISKHYEYEERRGVHMLSTMERALGGWAAFRARSPAVIIASVINMHAESAAARAPGPRLGESASALRPAAAAMSGAAEAGPRAANGGGAGLAAAEADASAADDTRVAVPVGVSDTAASTEGERAAGEGAGAATGVSEVSVASQAGSGEGTEEAPASASSRGVKRPRPGGQGGQEGVQPGAMPAVETLNPPGRQRFFEMFPLAGDAIAARAGHLSAADAGADGADAASGTAVMLDGESFQFDAEDAAERFAAALSIDDVGRLPPVVLMCSSTDTTVPWHESAEMFHVLRAAGVRARHLMYDDVGHAGFVMEWKVVRDAGGEPAGADGGELADERPRFLRDTIRLVRGEVNI
eukprot:jgi/Ulvmu1/2877/UM146_0019.1